MTYKLGIDTGGTFTDTVLVDDQGNMRVFKSSTTPHDFSIGVMNCISLAAEDVGLPLEQFLGKVSMIAHGSTVATNAALTGVGAKVGSISTKGFRDTLILRRRVRPGDWYREVQPVEPLCPRYLSLEVEERVDYTGNIVTPLNEEDVISAVETFKKEGVDSIAVCLLFSFFNSEHEKRIKDIVKREYPEAFVTISSDVLPKIREYERTSTVVLDAFVSPVVVAYVTKLEQSLKQQGFNGQFLLMQSNGGVQAWDQAIEHGLGTLNSGLAAAFPASLYFAELMNVQDVISVDMGGTSFDIGLVKNRTVKTTTESSIANHRNAYPMVDVLTIGSGGGSIAWVDPAGLLRVGPQSASSSPGPACYGRGGTEPTVTDANVLLGYLDPEFFLGGKMKIDRDASEKAFEKIANELGISVIEAAEAVYTVVNEDMGNATSEACVRNGYDPRDFLLVVGGGAGGSHSVRIAQKLGFSKILIPKQGPVYCAMGLVLSDLKHDYMQTYFSKLREADFSHLQKVYEEMSEAGTSTLEEEGVAKDDVSFKFMAEMRYVGQFREIEIELPFDALSREGIADIEALFSEKHEQLYTYSDPTREVEMLALKGVALGSVPRPNLAAKTLVDPDPSAAIRTERPVYFSEAKDFVSTTIYEGEKLRPGNVVDGPAVIEETATTIPVPPGVSFTVDNYGNYICVLEKSGGTENE